MIENYLKIKQYVVKPGAVQKGCLKFYPISDVGRPSEAHKLLLEYILSAKSVLDFGAGSLLFKKMAVHNGFKGFYKTLDIGKDASYDYKDISEIQEKFDLILCLEVIEHIPLEEFLQLAGSFKNRLNVNGKLIITTPNIHHINHFWKTDITHIRPYPYTDLCAILDSYGYKNVRIYRFAWRTCGFFKFLVKRILTRILEVDYATNICVIAET